MDNKFQKKTDLMFQLKMECSVISSKTQDVQQTNKTFLTNKEKQNLVKINVE